MKSSARPPAAAWTRRHFAASVAILSAAPFILSAKKPLAAAAAFDAAVEDFMKERKVPGAALAVVKDHRLVHARGFGWADREKKIPATAASLFRIASVSKPITAVAVLKLAGEKKLDLDAKVFDLLPLEAQLPKGATLDERWRRITLRQLLQHTAGFDRDQSGDPMFKAREIAKELGEPPPAPPAAVIRRMLGRPLDFDPGTRYAYSNFGYCVLGRVIEKITRQPYEKFVQQSVLAPAGIKRMSIGASLEAGRAEGEVRYYQRKDTKGSSVFTGSKDKVPWPYGGFYLEAMDAHGGWIASAVDLVRFATALDDAAPRPLLLPDMRALLHDPPAAPVSRDDKGKLKQTWYGCGWLVRQVKGGGFNLWHNGSLPGTYSLLVRLAGGITYAALFNQRSDDNWKNGDDPIDPALNRAAGSVTDWPVEDLFGRYA